MLKFYKRKLIFAACSLIVSSAWFKINYISVWIAHQPTSMWTGEISPLLPSSCRYVPTCSEYSMQAYKRYGVVKGTILTAWRLCRCNPLGMMFYWCLVITICSTFSGLHHIIFVGLQPCVIWCTCRRLWVWSSKVVWWGRSASAMMPGTCNICSAIFQLQTCSRFSVHNWN